jgi:hypothetical protein
VKCNSEFLATLSNWILLLVASILIAVIAIPIHELGHVIGYRLTGVAARLAYEHTIVPAGAHFSLSGIACGVSSTYIVCYVGIVLIYRKKWLLVAYPLAVILSLVRVLAYINYSIRFHTLAGLDESQMASFTGLNPYFWYVAFGVLFVVAWILIVRSLRYGMLRNMLLCAIPVVLYIVISTLCLYVVGKYFPQTA